MEDYTLGIKDTAISILICFQNPDIKEYIDGSWKYKLLGNSYNEATITSPSNTINLITPNPPKILIQLLPNGKNSPTFE